MPTKVYVSLPCCITTTIHTCIRCRQSVRWRNTRWSTALTTKLDYLHFLLSDLILSLWLYSQVLVETFLVTVHTILRRRSGRHRDNLVGSPPTRHERNLTHFQSIFQDRASCLRHNSQSSARTSTRSHRPARRVPARVQPLARQPNRADAAQADA